CRPRPVLRPPRRDGIHGRVVIIRVRPIADVRCVVVSAGHVARAIILVVPHGYSVAVAIIVDKKRRRTTLSDSYGGLRGDRDADQEQEGHQSRMHTLNLEIISRGLHPGWPQWSNPGFGIGVVGRFVSARRTHLTTPGGHCASGMKVIT